MKIRFGNVVPLIAETFNRIGGKALPPISSGSGMMAPPPRQRQASTLRFMQKFLPRKQTPPQQPVKPHMTWSPYQGRGTSLISQTMRGTQGQYRTAPLGKPMDKPLVANNRQRRENSGLSVDLQRRLMRLKGLDPDMSLDQNWTELQRRHMRLKGLDPDQT